MDFGEALGALRGLQGGTGRLLLHILLTRLVLLALFVLLQLYPAVLALALATQLQYFSGQLNHILWPEPLAVLDVSDELVPGGDGLILVDLVADGELFAALLLGDQQHLAHDVLVELLDDAHAAERGRPLLQPQRQVVLMTGGLIIGYVCVQDLPFEAEPLLVGVLLVVVVEDALLALDLLVIVPHDLVDALDGPLDARVEVIFYVVVAPPREPALL